MRIAQLAPLWERVPPQKYGGAELVVFLLTEELVKRGHEVTLFATGDSETKAKLVSIYPKALYRDKIPWTDYSWELINASDLYKKARDFDIIHTHPTADWFGLFFAPFVKTPSVHTLHNTQFHHHVAEYVKKENFISISDNQRKTYPGLNYVGTVYNGLDISYLKFNPNQGKYLVWLGKITFAKGTEEAIKVAQILGEQIILAGKVDPVDKKYYQEKIKPLIDNKNVKFIGEVGAFSKEKAELLGGAKALLVPINWDEPFGLVMPEAMACGTPVIAFRRGSVPEVVKDGETGFIVEPSDIDAMVEAVGKIDKIERKKCREWVKEKFTVEKMVDGYEKIYQKILGKS